MFKGTVSLPISHNINIYRVLGLPSAAHPSRQGSGVGRLRCGVLPCLVGVDGKEGDRGRRPENPGHVRLSRGTRERVCMMAQQFRN